MYSYNLYTIVFMFSISINSLNEIILGLLQFLTIVKFITKNIYDKLFGRKYTTGSDGFFRILSNNTESE